MNTGIVFFGVGVSCMAVAAVLGYFYARNMDKKNAASELIKVAEKEIERRDKHAAEVKNLVSACNTSRAKVSSRVRKVTARKAK